MTGVQAFIAAHTLKMNITPIILAISYCVHVHTHTDTHITNG